MLIFRNIFLICLTVCCLAGCEKNLTYSHLMRHPDLLRNEVGRCQALVSKTSEQAANCEVVMYAAANFMSLINTEREDPEKFGQQIMDAEVICAAAKSELKAAKQSLSQLEATPDAPEDKLKAAQDRLDAAKQAFHAKLDEVRILLAVVGVNSPD